MIINDWELSIDEELERKLNEEYLNNDITPEREDLFKAFELVKKEEVKVVFIGQDPYPTKGDAMGLSFSVKRDNNLPPSLKNIYKELESDLGIVRTNGDLSSIASQGVLFLNTILTTRVSKARSHNNLGWQKVTQKIIEEMSEQKNIIFVLLGKDAQKYKDIINLTENIVIETSHPSPLSAYRGFLGSKIFTQINLELSNQGKDPIDWNI